MEYVCIYEALPNNLFSTPFVILSVIELILTIDTIVNWRNNKNSGKIGMLIVLFVPFIIIVSTIYSYCSSQMIWDNYKSGNYYTVEGKIEDYEIGTKEKLAYPDRFTVNGVHFIIAESPSTGYGYSKRQYDGGSLRNGLYCKIYYIPYRFENVIMKLEIVQ